MEPDKTLALVSGANRGIGLAIATGLAKRGVRVLLGCRDLGRGQAACEKLEAEGLPVEPIQLDTTDDASVRAAAEKIAHAYGRLDILVNNAGISLDFDPTLSAAEKLQGALAVNVVGVTRTTEAMLPLMTDSPRPRIVNVSSELASFGLRLKPDWIYAGMMLPTYQASKAALNALTLSYAEQLRGKGFKVNAICPGYTATEATNFAGTRTPEQAAVVAINFALLDDDGPTGAFANDAGMLPW